jgi:hypothetical protein
MIVDRLYRASEGELIYHYCAPQAFVEIIRTRTIWLSAYYALNDSLERMWGYSVFDKAISELNQELDKQFAEIVRAIVIAAYSRSLVLIGSFSLDPDVWANGERTPMTVEDSQ